MRDSVSDTLSKPAYAPSRLARLPVIGPIIAEGLAFVLHPVPLRPERGAWSDQLRPLAGLLVLNLGVLFLLLPLLIGWTRAVGIETPRMMIEIPHALVLVMAVLILPPLEEVVFRGWLTGRPRALVALGVMLATGAAMFALTRSGMGQFTPVALGAGVAAALGGAWTLRRQEQAPAWFTRHFRWIFWGVTVLFASAHYSNYPTLTFWHLPVVLPQFWSGLVFAFTRLRFGLSRSVLLHCASNALVLVAFMIFGIPSA